MTLRVTLDVVWEIWLIISSLNSMKEGHLDNLSQILIEFYANSWQARKRVAGHLTTKLCSLNNSIYLPKTNKQNQKVYKKAELAQVKGLLSKIRSERATYYGQYFWKILNISVIIYDIVFILLY